MKKILLLMLTLWGHQIFADDSKFVPPIPFHNIIRSNDTFVVTFPENNWEWRIRYEEDPPRIHLPAKGEKIILQDGMVLRLHQGHWDGSFGKYKSGTLRVTIDEEKYQLEYTESRSNSHSRRTGTRIATVKK